MNTLKHLYALISCLALMCPNIETKAEKLVILHTNDTHSQIDPDEASGLGGILRRKVLVDSIRQAEQNVMLIDAGDAVQGTLFFNLYKGQVENALMDSLGYDLRILGNHEFDNGSQDLAKRLKSVKSKLISTNYRFTQQDLDSLFSPYHISTFGDKKVAFIGINLKPKGMIAEGNYEGIEYLDPYKAANSTAWVLKNLYDVDYVIAITHIGYTTSNTTLSDKLLAKSSQDIDAIIGGHSHTLVNPCDTDKWLIENANGRAIPVVQAGKGGFNLGKIEFDLDNGAVQYSLIPVDGHLDNRIDPQLAAVLQPYRQGIDSLMTTPIAQSAIELNRSEQNLQNFVADFIRDNGNRLLKAQNGKKNQLVDFAIINKGGIRRSLPKGPISEGMIITMLPFSNRTVVLDIEGDELLEALEIMAARGGDGLSSEAQVLYHPETRKIVSAKINGRDIDPDKTYRIATIDYLANGGDYLTPLREGKWVAQSQSVLFDDLINYLRKNYSKRKINPDGTHRMKPTGK